MNIKQVIDYIRNAQDITFIIGAGASRSAGIPMAGDLVNTIVKDFSHCLYGLSDEDRKNYGKVMGALSPADRKSLIEPLLAEKKMNWGHIALANVVLSTNVRRVLSFNFDFLLERAVSMLGSHLPVYDYGVAPSRETKGLADKAIFHLHGQSYGLTQLNTEDETKGHAENLDPLISDSLCNHLTIVIGYSGEADAAFDVMHKAYNSNNNLFWLGHDPEPSAHLKPLLDKNYATYIGKCDFDLTMIEIARGVGSWPIPIIDNPPAHVLNLLEPLPDFPVAEKQQTAILTTTRRRLADSAEDWAAERTGEEKAANALMSGRGGIDVDPSEDMSDEERELIAWRLITEGNALLEEAKTLDSKACSAKFAEAYKKYAAALAIKPDLHEALYNWGTALSEEAKALDGEVRFAKFAAASSKFASAFAIDPDHQDTLYNWGLCLSFKADTLSGDARSAKFAAASKKYAAAHAIEPGDFEALNNWAHALWEEAKGLNGQARDEKVGEAREKAFKAKEIKGKPLYNYACMLAITGKPNEALDELEACLEAGTLPDAAHLQVDDDMNSLRHEPRFIDLLQRRG